MTDIVEPLESQPQPQPQPSSSAPLSVITIDPAPDDGVTSVSFSPDSSTILFSTWAGTLRIHSSTTGTLRHEAKRYQYALLDSKFQSPTTILAASLDGSVLQTTITQSSTLEPWKKLGKHNDKKAARCIIPSLNDNNNLFLTGGWDGHIKLFDINSPTAQIVDISTKDHSKIFGATKFGYEHYSIFITSTRRILVLDLRNTSEFLYDRIPPTLQYQLRGISAPRNGSYYVVGSTEGRVAVDNVNNESKDSFSFKCHRVDGLAFPVNCIVHNDKYDSFATGGGDGHVAIWDADARKRISQFNRYATSIADIDFDQQSERMAIAVSYTFEDGEKDHPPDDILIRAVDDAHIATKKSREQARE